jgi:hypothetical protein
MLTKLLGASWKTTLLGWAVGVLIIIQGMLESGTAFPTDAAGWMKFVTGIVIGLLGQQAKSKDVSNAPIPLAVAQPVVTSPDTRKVIPPVAGTGATSP